VKLVDHNKSKQMCILAVLILLRLLWNTSDKLYTKY